MSEKHSDKSKGEQKPEPPKSQEQETEKMVAPSNRVHLNRQEPPKRKKG